MRTAALALFLSFAAFAPAVAADATVTNGPRVVVPAHDIERGEVIADSDLVVATVTPDRMRPDTVTTMADVVGREARRLLHAGEIMRSEDLRMPVLVVKGSTVTMTFVEPGIMLTATGRAMSDAGLAEAVMVQNPVSFRQVPCIVTGAATVRAAEPAQNSTVAANP